jgi:hypothetical protein
LRQLDELGLTPETSRKLLRENAIQLFKLGAETVCPASAPVAAGQHG